MSPFLLRIKKLETDKVLIPQCKRNGWTDLCGELEHFEKVLEHDKDAESKTFIIILLSPVFSFNFNEGQCVWSGSILSLVELKCIAYCF